MSPKNIQAIILAAGKSTRLNSGHNKLLEQLCGQPMIIFVTKLFSSLNIKTTVVVGHQKESVQECIEKYHPNEDISFVVQASQRGTADALNCARDQWHQEHILVINGDMPLVTTEIIENLYQQHITSNATVSFVISHLSEPNNSYGRVIKKDNQVSIVEAREFAGDSAEHCCINAGIYIIKKSFLEQHMPTLQPNQVSNELHITDLVTRASEQGEIIATVNAPFDYVRGINNQHELWAAEQVQRSNIIKYWMERGVRFSVAHNVHIDLDVTIGTGSYIGCGVHLLYGTKVGTNCKIHEYATLEHVTVGDNSNIYPFSIIKDTTIGSDAQIGPFAHIRNQTTIADQTTIGNFVEIKNSNIGTGSSAKHLAYIGDANVGSHVNIGAGTITCNFDGKKKHKTIIEDNVFVGSNNTLVAPVTIKDGAFTAAGSTITQDVPAQALAIARAQQVNKLEYATKYTRLDSLPDTDNETTFLGATRSEQDLLEYETR